MLYLQAMLMLPLLETFAADLGERPLFDGEAGEQPPEELEEEEEEEAGEA
mgnify:CR=1 FL=1